MNRRSFLSFLSVAPVAFPMAASTEYAQGGFVSATAKPLYGKQIPFVVGQAINGSRIIETTICVSVGENINVRPTARQMAQRFLKAAERHSSVIGESVPQTERSPES